MSGSLSGLRMFMRAIIEQEPWRLDPLVVRQKWDEDAYRLVEHGRGKQLCFAIMEDDGIVLPHPPVQRALRMVRAALQAAGHKGGPHMIYILRLSHVCVSDSVEGSQDEGDLQCFGK